MLKFLYTFIFFVLFANTFSQVQFVSGKLIDESKQASIGSSVFLLNAKDSSFVKGTVADIDGFFKIENILANSYVLKIVSLGYNPVFRTIQITSQPIDLGFIILKQNSLNLKEVKVQGQISLATQNGDTTSFNSKAYKVNKDASAEDLISKMPGVAIVDGKVQAQGEEGRGYRPLGPCPRAPKFRVHHIREERTRLEAASLRLS
jgi:hypothetical protein